MDSNDDLTVTNFKELGVYIKQNLLESLKETKSTWNKRLRKCKCNKNNTSVHAEIESSDDEVKIQKDEEQLVFKFNALQLTQRHKLRRLKKDFISEDALIFYLENLLNDNNKHEKVNIRFVEDLINSGIDVNYHNHEFENAIYFAAKLDSDDLVRFLLEKNINFKQKNKSGYNVFHMVCRNSNANILKLLAVMFEDKEELEAYLNAQNEIEKQTPLHLAAKEGSKAVAECLIVDYEVNKEVLDYKDRTPLFIAAEYNRKSMVKLLMSLKCNVSFTDKSKKETLNNIKGQTALFWIVTKMPDIASDALDQLYEPNPYLRKDKHYLAPLEPKVLKKSPENDVIPKSVLASIVEMESLDLIVHPTILCLIDRKWKKFARRRAWFDFFLTIIYVAVWITFGLWVPYNMRYEYDFSKDTDRFRLCLFIIGILFTLYLIFNEIKEVYNDFKYQNKANHLRKKELDEYRLRYKNSEIHTMFIKDEELLIKQNNIFKVLKNYFFDIWNMYDLVSIVLLIVCIGTHIDDILNHSESKARTHIRIMSITVVFITARLLKSARIIIPKFGTLVMILYYSISDMIIWFLLYLVIWLSFSCSFWMIYGGVKFDKDSNEDGLCRDVYATEFNTNYSCSTVAISQFERYDLTAYFLYRLTFGNALDEEKMNLIDDQLTNPLIGAYIGLTALVLVNIFIALLSATFNRVYEKAEAYIIFQRAIEILSKEKSMSYDERKNHIKYIRKIGSPYIDIRYHEIITSTDDKIEKLEDELKEQKKLLKEMSSSLDQANNLLTYQSNNAFRTEKKLQEEIKNLKEILLNFLNAQSNMLTGRGTISDTNKKPQFDILNASEFTSPSNVFIE